MKRKRDKYIAKSIVKPSQKKTIGLGRLISLLQAKSLSARYNALERDPLRKTPVIRQDYTITEQNFDASKRLLAYAVCDDLFDNSSIGSTIETCIRLTIGTKGGNAIFTGENKEYWQTYFDSWKKNCGYTENENLQEILSQVLRIVKIHGDCIIWLDPVLTGGKIRIFDADQITNLSDFDSWKRANEIPEDWRQVEGVVIDSTGVVKGYFVTMERNHSCVTSADAVFLGVDVCRRVSYRKKISQYRGEPSILANQRITEDTTALLQSEIAASKLNAELPLVIEQPSNVASNELEATLEGFEDGELLGQEITNETLEELQNSVDYSQTFKQYSGKASIATVENGTKVTNLAASGRPSQQIQSWVDLLNDSNGKLLGVMSCLSRGRADNSYSSGQIELSISWAAFEADQKLLERAVIDYVLGIIAPHQKYFVKWPKEFEIDPEKTQRVIEAKLRSGLATYREILGIEWQKQLEQLAIEQAKIKELGLTNLSIFQSVAGAIIPEGEKDDE